MKEIFIGTAKAGLYMGVIMDITDLILFTILAWTVLLSYGIYLIRQDIDELKELINKKL